MGEVISFPRFRKVVAIDVPKIEPDKFDFSYDPSVLASMPSPLEEMRRERLRQWAADFLRAGIVSLDDRMGRQLWHP